MSTTLATILVALITAVFGPVIVEWVRVILKQRTNVSPVKEAIDINELVDHQ